MKNKLTEQKKKTLFQNKRMLKLAGLIKENINDEQKMGILDDIDNDIENSDMDAKDCVFYLEDIIKYCQKLKKEFVEKTYDDVLSKPEVDENLDEAGPRIPSGWKEDRKEDIDQDEELYGGEILRRFRAPMEGWDDDHEDMVTIIKSPEGLYFLDIYTAFGEDRQTDGYKTEVMAFLTAIVEMKNFKADWNDD